MKFFVLAALVALCSAVSVYPNRQIHFGDEDNVYLHGAGGSQYVVSRQPGERCIELVIKGVDTPNKKIKIDSHSCHIVSLEGFQLGQKFQHYQQLEQQPQQYQQQRYEQHYYYGDVQPSGVQTALFDILKQHQGFVGEQQYQTLLNNVQDAVERGQICQVVYHLLAHLDQKINEDWLQQHYEKYPQYYQKQHYPQYQQYYPQYQQKYYPQQYQQYQHYPQQYQQKQYYPEQYQQHYPQYQQGGLSWWTPYLNKLRYGGYPYQTYQQHYGQEYQKQPLEQFYQQRYDQQYQKQPLEQFYQQHYGQQYQKQPFQHLYQQRYGQEYQKQPLEQFYQQGYERQPFQQLYQQHYGQTYQQQQPFGQKYEQHYGQNLPYTYGRQFYGGERSQLRDYLSNILHKGEVYGAYEPYGHGLQKYGREIYGY